MAPWTESTPKCILTFNQCKPSVRDAEQPFPVTRSEGSGFSSVDKKDCGSGMGCRGNCTARGCLASLKPLVPLVHSRSLACRADLGLRAGPCYYPSREKLRAPASSKAQLGLLRKGPREAQPGPLSFLEVI